MDWKKKNTYGSFCLVSFGFIPEALESVARGLRESCSSDSDESISHLAAISGPLIEPLSVFEEISPRSISMQDETSPTLQVLALEYKIIVKLALIDAITRHHKSQQMRSNVAEAVNIDILDEKDFTFEPTPFSIYLLNSLNLLCKLI